MIYLRMKQPSPGTGIDANSCRSAFPEGRISRTLDICNIFFNFN
ncbi:hypothetical protein [Microcoleus sp.]